MGSSCTWLISTKTISATHIFRTNSSEEEDGSRRPLLATVRSLRPAGPSMHSPLFCSFQLWLWRSAFQSFTDEAHRRLHALLRGKPPTEDFLLRKRVSPFFPSKTGAKTKRMRTLPKVSRRRFWRAYPRSPI